MQREHGPLIALRGVIVGGGIRADGPGQLGVFLNRDPAGFRPRALRRSAILLLIDIYKILLTGIIGCLIGLLSLALRNLPRGSCRGGDREGYSFIITV